MPKLNPKPNTPLNDADQTRPNLERPNLEQGADDLTFVHYKLMRKIRSAITENGQLVAIFAVVFVNLVGFGLVVPLISFFAESLHAQAWQVTLMFTAYSLGQFFAEPLCGRLSDIIGRKPILIATTGLSVLFYALLGFAPNIWLAIVIRFFSGLASGNVSTIQGYISDVSRPDQRASRMSLIGAAFSLGFVAGPVLGFLADTEAGMSGFRPPLFIAAGMAALATLGVIFFVHETRKETREETREKTKHEPNKDASRAASLKSRAKEDILKTIGLALSSRAIMPVILSTLCYMAALAGLESTFGLWSHTRYHWLPKDISIIFLFIGATAALMQLVFTRPLVRRYGESKVLAGGLFVFGLSFALQALNHNPFFVLPLVVFGTLGQAVIFANICAIISISTPNDRQGAMLGLNQSVGAMARITGPIFAGLFFTHLGPDSTLWMGALMCIPAAWLALFAGRGGYDHNLARK